jgi:hypothetical protein
MADKSNSKTGEKEMESIREWNRIHGLLIRKWMEECPCPKVIESPSAYESIDIMINWIKDAKVQIDDEKLIYFKEPKDLVDGNETVHQLTVPYEKPIQCTLEGEDYADWLERNRANILKSTTLAMMQEGIEAQKDLERRRSFYDVWVSALDLEYEMGHVNLPPLKEFWEKELPEIEYDGIDFDKQNVFAVVSDDGNEVCCTQVVDYYKVNTTDSDRDFKITDMSKAISRDYSQWLIIGDSFKYMFPIHWNKTICCAQTLNGCKTLIVHSMNEIRPTKSKGKRKKEYLKLENKLFRPVYRDQMTRS